MAENDKSSGKFGSGILGLVIGSIVGAAAVIFSDKKTRENAVKKLKEVEKGTDKTVKELQKKSVVLKAKGEQILKNAKKEIDKRLEIKEDK